MSALKQYYPTVTPEYYFYYRERNEGKYELHDGTILAMAGGTLPHNRIEVALTTQLSLIVDPAQCETFNSNQSVGVEVYECYYYPDATLVCAEPILDDRGNVVNPILIVEVLSQSTALYDRNTKFERYKAIPTLQYYLLVSQDAPRLELFIRPENGDEEWASTTIDGLEAELALPIFVQSLKLAEIYAKITFE